MYGFALVICKKRYFYFPVIWAFFDIDIIEYVFRACMGRFDVKCVRINSAKHLGHRKKNFGPLSRSRKKRPENSGENIFFSRQPPKVVFPSAKEKHSTRISIYLVLFTFSGFE